MNNLPVILHIFSVLNTVVHSCPIQHCALFSSYKQISMHADMGHLRVIIFGSWQSNQLQSW